MSKGTVAILGGGNGGHAASVDLTRKGFTVRLYEDARFAPNMESVFRSKEIAYEGVFGEGVVKLSMVTSDMGEAVTGAETILVAVPAFAHKYYAEALAPLLAEGQSVLVFAGAFGSLIFWQEMKKRGAKKVYLAETYTLPYATRLAGPGKSLILSLTDPIKTGVMPASKTAETIEKLLPLYPVEAAASVLDCGLYTMNPVVHVPGCILNAGRIELMKGEFWFYREAITPGVGRVTEQLDEERMAIIKKLGYQPETVLDSLKAMGSQGGNVSEAITTNEQFAKIKGPDGFKNRYYAEDIPFGIVPWAYLGRALGVPTPVMDALITLSSGLMERDCWKTGRNMRDIGLEGMSLDQILEYLQNG